jgi:Leucine-rich repeat (LRR) protein
MKTLLFLVIIYLISPYKLFGQVPDYIKEFVKNNPVPKGTFYDIDEAKKMPDKVIELDLTQLNLTEVPEQIKIFKNIEILDLGYNDIRTLPIWLTTLKKLKIIRMSHNKFDELPDFCLISHR